MSKKDVIIIITGVAILVAIFIVSFFLSEKEQGTIDVSTDKEEYSLGESLKVKIANNTRDNICFSTCYPYYFERKDNEWTGYEYEECPREDMVDSCVDPREVKAFELELPVMKKGLHRLLIQACIGCAGSELFRIEKELFSNPFMIK